MKKLKIYAPGKEVEKTLNFLKRAYSWYDKCSGPTRFILACVILMLVVFSLPSHPITFLFGILYMVGLLIFGFLRLCGKL